MNYFKGLYFLYNRSPEGFLRNALRTTVLYMAGKSIIGHHHARVKGISRISIADGKTLVLGMFPNNLGVPSEVTSVNVMGSLRVDGHFEIGRGSRISIGKNATVTLGSGFINNNCLFAVEHKLTIGNDCAIGWNVQLIDDDYHQLSFEGKLPSSNDGVSIGNHVWIGSNVSVLKNSLIPDGCVVASGSLINQKFSETNCLIGGRPAKIIRRNVQWQ